MRSFKKILRGIEEKAGITEQKEYCFLRIKYGYRLISDREWIGRVIYKKGDFEGEVIIHEMQNGKCTEIIPSASDEGKRILLEHGYEIIDKDSAKKE